MFKFLRSIFGGVCTRLMFDQHAWTTEMAVTGVADIDAAIPEYWAYEILHDGDRESFWTQLSGKEGSRLPVIDKTGPLKQKGDQLTINTIAQLMGTGVTGESVLKGNEELLAAGTLTITCDVVRHAVAVSRKSTKQANFDEVNTAGIQLKDWMTRKRDNDVFTTILADTTEVIYAGNSNTAVGDLNAVDGDVFGVNEIEMIRLALIRKGSMPIAVKKQHGRTIPCYGIVFGEVEDYNLSTNTTFVQTVKDAWDRYKGNNNHPLFEGVIGYYRNMLLYPYYSILPIPQGTPLRPETIVFATLTTTATTLSVGGATQATGVTEAYTLFFATSGSLQIADEILSYTGKTVNSFTGLSRGVSSTTAVQHAPDALVTQRNIASVIGFGAEAVLRATGEEPEPIGESDDYGEQIGIGIRAYYGQSLKKDKRLGRANNIVICKVYSQNPGMI